MFKKVGESSGGSSGPIESVKMSTPSAIAYGNSPPKRTTFVSIEYSTKPIMKI